VQKMKNRVAILTLTLMAAFVPSASSSGTEWPQRTVHIIVPFPAGADAPVRALAEPLAKRWKQPIVIENRPGADGIIGVAAFTGGQHDDHTLLYYSAAAISTFPVMHQKLPYDPTRDVVPISSVVDGSIFIAVSESLKISSLAELVAFARAQPGELNYWPPNGGSFGILLPGFVKSENLDMVQVSYREQSLGVQDIAAGRIHVMMGTAGGLLPLARAGKVRLIAVTNNSRSAIATDVPTAVEAGYPQLAFEGLQGFFGPRDMPAERKNRIAADVRAVATDPAVADPLAAVGYYVRGSTPAEFAAAIEEQRAKMAGLAKLVGLKPVP
jgi:tripartite-type tricarboxylate transporter receptor subunit TctC